MAMLNVTLPRTGDRLLQFIGKVVAMGSSRKIAGVDSERWHVVELYVTAGGKYVVAVSYKTKGKGELPHDTAVVLDTEDDVAHYLKKEVNPVEHLPVGQSGFNSSETAEEIKKDLISRYRTVVTGILASLAPEKVDG